jgi:hypothetical protein
MQKTASVSAKNYFRRFSFEKSFGVGTTSSFKLQKDPIANWMVHGAVYSNSKAP